jgi:hypothetical protein
MSENNKTRFSSKNPREESYILEKEMTGLPVQEG